MPAACTRPAASAGRAPDADDVVVDSQLRGRGAPLRVVDASVLRRGREGGAGAALALPAS
jgi:hypothetical protein